MSTTILRSWRNWRCSRSSGIGWQDLWERLCCRSTGSQHVSTLACLPEGCTSLLTHSGGELMAAAPLMFSDTSSVPTLRFVGNPYCQLYEPGGLIHRDESAL